MSLCRVLVQQPTSPIRLPPLNRISPYPPHTYSDSVRRVRTYARFMCPPHSPTLSSHVPLKFSGVTFGISDCGNADLYGGLVVILWKNLSLSALYLSCLEEREDREGKEGKRRKEEKEGKEDKKDEEEKEKKVDWSSYTYLHLGSAPIPLISKGRSEGSRLWMIFRHSSSLPHFGFSVFSKVTP